MRLCYHEFAEDEPTKKEATRLSYKISIEAARVNAGFSQREAAKKLKICPETLSKWEKGKVGIKAADLMRLCELYKTPVEFISLP